MKFLLISGVICLTLVAVVESGYGGGGAGYGGFGGGGDYYSNYKGSYYNDNSDYGDCSSCWKIKSLKLDSAYASQLATNGYSQSDVTIEFGERDDCKIAILSCNGITNSTIITNDLSSDSSSSSDSSTDEEGSETSPFSGARIAASGFHATAIAECNSKGKWKITNSVTGDDYRFSRATCVISTNAKIGGTVLNSGIDGKAQINTDSGSGLVTASSIPPSATGSTSHTTQSQQTASVAARIAGSTSGQLLTKSVESSTTPATTAAKTDSNKAESTTTPHSATTTAAAQSPIATTSGQLADVSTGSSSKISTPSSASSGTTSNKVGTSTSSN